MDLFPRSFGEGLEPRLTGPVKGRFVVRPLVAIALGIRDGIADAKQQDEPPYFIRVLFKSGCKALRAETRPQEYRHATDCRNC
jgi:hypothetical protein